MYWVNRCLGPMFCENQASQLSRPCSHHREETGRGVGITVPCNGGVDSVAGNIHFYYPPSHRRAPAHPHARVFAFAFPRPARTFLPTGLGSTSPSLLLRNSERKLRRCSPGLDSSVLGTYLSSSRYHDMIYHFDFCSVQRRNLVLPFHLCSVRHGRGKYPLVL